MKLHYHFTYQYVDDKVNHRPSELEWDWNNGVEIINRHELPQHLLPISYILLLFSIPCSQHDLQTSC